MQWKICGKYGHFVNKCFNLRDLLVGKGCNSSLTTMLAHGSSEVTNSWLMDLGATNHLSNNFNNLTQSTPYSGNDKVIVRNDSFLTIEGHGIMSMKYLSHFHTIMSPIEVLHTHWVSHNLVSIHKLCLENNVIVEFHTLNSLWAHTLRVLAQGVADDGLYRLHGEVLKSLARLSSSSALFSTFSCLLDVVPKSTFPIIKTHVWYSRLAHPSPDLLHRLMNLDFIQYDKFVPIGLYSNCSMSKLQKLSFKSFHVLSDVSFALVYLYLWIAPIVSTTSAKYFMLIVDYHTRYVLIYFF